MSHRKTGFCAGICALAIALPAEARATSRAVDTVALTLWAECRGEPEAGRRAVASVIWTRAGGRPEQLRRVCMAKGQFSCWNGAAGRRLAVQRPSGAVWAWCLATAGQMQRGRFVPSVKATHYHAVGVSPHWAGSMRRVTRIGGHTFWREHCKQRNG